MVLKLKKPITLTLVPRKQHNDGKMVAIFNPLGLWCFGYNNAEIIEDCRDDFIDLYLTYCTCDESTLMPKEIEFRHKILEYVYEMTVLEFLMTEQTQEEDDKCMAAFVKILATETEEAHKLAIDICKMINDPEVCPFSREVILEILFYNKNCYLRGYQYIALFAAFFDGDQFLRFSAISVGEDDFSDTLKSWFKLIKIEDQDEDIQRNMRRMLDGPDKRSI